MAQRSMTKAELVSALAEQTDCSPKHTKQVLDALAKVVTETIASGDAITIPGVGKVSTRERAARTIRNPRTGEPMDKPADRALKMTFTKALKDACN